MREKYMEYIMECLQKASEHQLRQILIILWHYMA